MKIQNPDADLMDLIDLAGGVAHESNNYLNSILLHLSLLERKELSPDAVIESAEIRQLGFQTAALMNQWQRCAEHRQSPLQPVDLNRLVSEAVNAPTCAIPLDVELAPALPLVLGIPADLKRLLGHLLESAAAAVAPGPGTIRLVTEKTNHLALLRIEDTGPGVPPDQLPMLFRPFARIRPGSDGLGLAICKVIAGRLQGSLQGWTTPAGGMAFQVELQFAPQ